WQQMPMVGLAAILRIENRQGGRDIPTEHLCSRTAFNAANPSNIDVLRLHGAAAGPNDQIVNLSFERVQAPRAPLLFAFQTQLIALRLFRVQVRIARCETRVRRIQIIEGRRLESSAIGSAEYQVVAQVVAPAQIAGVMIAKLLV